MPAADPRPKFESTIAPPTRNLGTGLRAGTLGVRDEAGLDLAFGGNPGGPPDSGSGVTTAEKQNTTFTAARQLFGELPPNSNPDFPQYQRDFMPQAPAGGSLTEEYQEPRNKTSINNSADLSRLHIGTPYSPTVASPGTENGVDPTSLRSVAGTSTAALTTQKDAIETDLNPLNPDFATISSPDTPVGTVRRFRMGEATNSRAVLNIPAR